MNLSKSPSLHTAPTNCPPSPPKPSPPLGNFIAEGYGGFPDRITVLQPGDGGYAAQRRRPHLPRFSVYDRHRRHRHYFEYGANSDDVFGNSGWLFEACPGCFNAPPSPAPTLDPASVIAVQAGQQAALILQNLPPGQEVLWFDADQKMERYASTDNFFEPMIIEGTTFYGAYRDLTTGCVSELLPVMVCVVDTPTSGVGDLDGDGIPDACDPDVCINTAVESLKGYVEGLGLSSGMKRAINTRLDKAVYRFCNDYPISYVISTLNSVIDYVDYQEGNGDIPSNDADYLIGQVNLLIDALNNGVVVCCTGANPRPVNPGEGATTEAQQLAVSPNPFRDQVSVRLNLTKAGPATLEVFNLNGRRVATLHSGYLDAGYQDFSWNSTDDGGQQLSSGLYLIRLQTEEGVQAKKVSLMR
ncbi:MAG: T9SS type A sorting domain-containing protein [Lewinellaceae bacterium]|nr:T9SS type A sorting domain-containing protein [Lewinellaceae bacterium]